MRKLTGKLLSYLVTGSLLFGLVACGDDDDDNGVNLPDNTPQSESGGGTFAAVLRPVNANIASVSNGAVSIRNTDDDFDVRLVMAGAPSGDHMQAIHLGTSCPTDSNDTNNDGVVDIVEATALIGQEIVPLDGDLNSQALGQEEDPSGSNYEYRETASYTQLLNDLWLPDDNTNDNLAKLTPNQDLPLEDRVVVVYGVPTSTTLPTTVATVGGLPANETVPIACGKLTRLTSEDSGGTTTGGTTTGGTTTGGTTTGGTTTGGTTTGGTTTGGTTTGGTTNGGTTTIGTTGL